VHKQHDGFQTGWSDGSRNRIDKECHTLATFDRMLDW